MMYLRLATQTRKPSPFQIGFRSQSIIERKTPMQRRVYIDYHSDSTETPISNNALPTQYEVMQIIEATIESIMLLPQEQREMQIAKLKRRDSDFSRMVLQILHTR